MSLPFRFSETDTTQRYLIHGATFLRIDGDSVEYSVWIPSGRAAGSTLSLQSTLSGDTFEIPLSYSGIGRIGGCADSLAPINPWLPLPPGVIQFPKPGDVTCPAFEEFEIFRGVLTSSELAALLATPESLSASLPGQHPYLLVTGPWSGGFEVVPEPVAIHLFLAACIVILIRRHRAWPPQKAEAEQVVGGQPPFSVSISDL